MGETHLPQPGRRPVSIDGVARLLNGSTVPIRVVDLFYDGCTIETPVDLERKESIRLTVRGSIISADVCWCSEGKAGVSFASEPSTTPAAAPLSPAVGGPQMTIQATMQRHGQPKYLVSVVDLSVDGCKVEFVDRPDVDERVHIRFSGLAPIEGQVRWVAGIEAAVAFERPIHPAVLDILLQKSTGS